jgi:hypothetical protein
MVCPGQVDRAINCSSISTPGPLFCRTMTVSFSANQVNGVQKSPIIGVTMNPTNPRLWQRWRKALARPPRPRPESPPWAPAVGTRFADAQSQYSNWSSNPVGVALVIVCSPMDDGNYLVPAITCIHCPSVLRRGHTVDRTWDRVAFLPGSDASPRHPDCSRLAQATGNI